MISRSVGCRLMVDLEMISGFRVPRRLLEQSIQRNGFGKMSSRFKDCIGPATVVKVFLRGLRFLSATVVWSPTSISLVWSLYPILFSGSRLRYVGESTFPLLLRRKYRICVGSPCQPYLIVKGRAETYDDCNYTNMKVRPPAGLHIRCS